MKRKCPKCNLEIPISRRDKKVHCACGHSFEVNWGLGDWIGWLILTLTGIKPCKACERRKSWLNRFRFW